MSTFLYFVIYFPNLKKNKHKYFMWNKNHLTIKNFNILNKCTYLD